MASLQGPLGVAAFAMVIPTLVAFAVYALVFSLLAARRRRGEGERETADHFITARGSVGRGLLAFTFYASGMGSWVTTAPANYASWAGLLGLSAYAVATGAPMVAAARLGGLARAADPEASSLPHFLQRRFGGKPGGWRGAAIGLLASLVMLLNMVLFLLAEYATLGSLFRSFVGASGALAALPVLLMALLTTAYTSAGGLLVSIYTDRAQAVSSLMLVVLLAVFVGTSSVAGDGLPPLSREQAGWTYSGFSSLLTMPLSLLSSVVFSEAIWQRVWASESSRLLTQAAWLGGLAMTLVVFAFGFVGFLALWSGRASPDDTDPNLYFFAFFSRDASAGLDSIPGLLALVCAAVMSEGAVDSQQNGITATLSSTLLAGEPLWKTRLLVVVFNVPLAILGATPAVASVLQLFLVSNLACTACLLPVTAALLPQPRVRRLVGETGVVLGCTFGWLGLSAYGCLRSGELLAGIRLAWLENNYGYDYFLAALASSLLGLACGCGLGCIAYGSAQPGRNACSDGSDSSSDGSTASSSSGSRTGVETEVIGVEVGGAPGPRGPSLKL